jgi:hypothetical protein
MVFDAKTPKLQPTAERTAVHLSHFMKYMAGNRAAAFIYSRIEKLPGPM